MVSNSKYLDPEKDYLSLLLSGVSTRKHFQMFLSSNPNAPTANKIRQALAIHMLLMDARKCYELIDDKQTPYIQEEKK